MTPNLIMSLDIEPITMMWNGQAISLPGTYELVPDEMVKHLHRRVMAIALHERKRIPFCGKLVGQARNSMAQGKHKEASARLEEAEEYLSEYNNVVGIDSRR